MIRRTRRAYFLLLGLAFSFFGTLGLGAAFFPTPYDWRYRVISSLASPKDNPRYYWIAALGLVITGIFLWILAGDLRRVVNMARPRLAAWICRLQRAGCACLNLTALISGKNSWFGWRRAHEDWAELAGFCLGLAFLGWTYGLVKSAGERNEKTFPGRALIALTFLPLSGLLLSRVSLFLIYRIYPRPTYEWAKHFFGCSLALWEWAGAVCLYFYLVLVMRWDGNRAPERP